MHDCIGQNMLELISLRQSLEGNALQLWRTNSEHFEVSNSKSVRSPN